MEDNFTMDWIGRPTGEKKGSKEVVRPGEVTVQYYSKLDTGNIR